MKVFRGKLESSCLSIDVSICVQNTSVCQSTGEGIKSHLVTALVLIGEIAGYQLFLFAPAISFKRPLWQSLDLFCKRSVYLCVLIHFQMTKF